MSLEGYEIDGQIPDVLLRWRTIEGSGIFLGNQFPLINIGLRLLSKERRNSVPQAFRCHHFRCHQGCSNPNESKVNNYAATLHCLASLYIAYH